MTFPQMDVYITSAICMQMGRLEFQGMGEVDFLQSMIKINIIIMFTTIFIRWLLPSLSTPEPTSTPSSSSPTATRPSTTASSTRNTRL